MTGLVVAASPAFLLLLLVEWLVHRFDPDDDARGYDAKDTATSVTLGVVQLFIGGLKVVTLTGFAVVGAALTPLHLPAHSVWTWTVALVLIDLAVYWMHRAEHRIRLFWAHHSVHHSSQYYNISTAMRQGWAVPLHFALYGVIIVPMALLGIPPWVIATASAIDQIYQLPIHTERIDKLWAPIEFVFNTPSHHRVHHGSNNPYLDKNFGGILIIWDRLFGTYTPEGERAVYGLTHNIDTFNPIEAAFHEFAAIARDLRDAQHWRDRLGYVFGPPGWKPAGRNHPALPVQ